MNTPLHVGVIGLGRAGEKHAKTYRRLPFVELKAVCDISRQRVDEFINGTGISGFTNYKALLDDPEIQAVSIVLPDDLHLQVALDTMNADKHILLEKPIASSLSDGKTILDAAGAYDKTFMVGHNLRFDPRHTMARDSIIDGEIGDILYTSCRRNSVYGSALKYSNHTDTHIHLMIHDIDYINWIMNSPPVSVYAKSREVLLKDRGMKDVIIAMVEYGNGALANLEACWVLPDNSPTKLDDKMEIVGTKGAIYINSCDSGLGIVSQSRVLYPDTMYWPTINGEVGGTFLDELSTFINCVISGKPPLCGAEEAYLALLVVDGIARSLQKKREVALTTDHPG